MKRILFTELCKKEVVCDGDGKKLGYPADIELDKCGTVRYLIVPKKSLFCLFGTKNCMRLPWCEVDRIGIDIIWIRGCCDNYKYE